jgi:hypothetical protein
MEQNKVQHNSSLHIHATSQSDKQKFYELTTALICRMHNVTQHSRNSVSKRHHTKATLLGLHQLLPLLKQLENCSPEKMGKILLKET